MSANNRIDKASTASASGDSRSPRVESCDLSEQKLRPLGAVERCLARAGFSVNRLLVHLFFRMKVVGKERLPADGPYALAPNHVSHLDPAVIAAALPSRRLSQVFWAARPDATRRNCVRRWASRLAKTIPVGGRTAPLVSLSWGETVLQEGYVLVWFPEGTRSFDGRLKPFKDGLGVLLARRGCPVVPVILHGVHEAMPRGRRLPRFFSHLVVEFGEPLDPAALEQEGHGESAAERIIDALRRRMLALQASASVQP